MDSTQTSTALSKDEQAQFTELFRSTPAAAMPVIHRIRSRHPETVADVYLAVESIIETLKIAMASGQEARDELGNIERDLKAAGRVLSRLGLAAK